MKTEQNPRMKLLRSDYRKEFSPLERHFSLFVFSNFSVALRNALGSAEATERNIDNVRQPAILTIQ